MHIILEASMREPCRVPSGILREVLMVVNARSDDAAIAETARRHRGASPSPTRFATLGWMLGAFQEHHSKSVPLNTFLI